MKYTVVWKPVAEAELAAMWTQAADRAAVTAAANQIDELLKTKPHEQGESRIGAIRVMFIHPVDVFFNVDDEDRRVEVIRVWLVV